MSLRYALLGLLTAQSMSGYDLAKVFDRSVAYVWHAPHSQIYPELRRMDAEGLITAESSQRGQRRVKRIYSITPSGLEELRRWVSEVTVPDRVRDAQRLKSTYFEFGSFDNARGHLKAHLEHYAMWERLWSAHKEQLTARQTPLIRERLAHADAADHDAIVAYKVHAYVGLIDQARAEVKWARDGLRLVDELEAADLRRKAGDS